MYARPLRALIPCSPRLAATTALVVAGLVLPGQSFWAGTARAREPGAQETAPTKDPRALEILAAANEATEAVRRIRYEFRYEGQGVWKGELDGTVWIEQRDPMPRSRFRTVATMSESPGGYGEFPREFEVATDSERAILIDHDDRRVEVASESVGANHVTRTLGYVVWYQFVQGDPYKWAMEGSESIEYVGRAVVDGTECEGVHVVYPAGNVNKESTWWFGVEDHLPRKQRLIGELAGNRRPSFEFVISDIQPGIELEAGDFRPEPPEGYTVIDADERSMEVGSPSPDWTARTAEGEEITLTDLRGEIVILDFWSSWSLATARLTPRVQELHEAFAGEGVRVLGVNVWEDDPPAAIRAAHGADYPTLVDGEPLADLYKIMWQPAMVVIGPEGRILFREQGYSEDREDRVRKILRDARRD